MHAPDFLAMAYLPLPHCVPRKLQRRFRLLGCKWGVPGFCKLDGFKKVSLLNFNVGLFITFSNVAVSKSLFEATDEELKSSMPPPSSRRKVATAAKAKPTPTAKVASRAKNPPAEVVVPSGATTETPVKEGKRCSKSDKVPGDTPEVSTTHPPQVTKRQRGKQADPDPAMQIQSLKEARLLNRSSV